MSFNESTCSRRITYVLCFLKQETQSTEHTVSHHSCVACTYIVHKILSCIHVCHVHKHILHVYIHKLIIIQCHVLCAGEWK